jgi:hypothetical protein
MNPKRPGLSPMTLGNMRSSNGSPNDCLGAQR